MDDYHDDQWLEIIARQSEIAFKAYAETLDCAAADLAKRLNESEDLVERALSLDPEATDPDGTKPWLGQLQELRERIRVLMGDSFVALETRIKLLTSAYNNLRRRAREAPRRKRRKLERPALWVLY